MSTLLVTTDEDYLALSVLMGEKTLSRQRWPATKPESLIIAHAYLYQSGSEEGEFPLHKHHSLLEKVDQTQSLFETTTFNYSHNRRAPSTTLTPD